MKLDFNAIDIDMPQLDKNKIESWINLVAAKFELKAGNLTYIFVNDEMILEVNREFLNHDYYTDIITFDYSRRGTISGDMYISVDTVASNAEAQRVTYEDELHRVLIHGVLHLCGINDKGPGEREVMEGHENDALALYKNLK